MSKDLFNVLVKPVYSEKATFLNGMSKYVFVVQKSATKDLVKSAIESVFDVKVASINIIMHKGKAKKFKGVKGKRADKKKAVVSLKQGHSIELVSGE